jgi:hypothetical protein
VPDDFRVLTDMKIGTHARMLSSKTDADLDALLAGCRDALVAAGYQVLPGGSSPQQINYTGTGFGIESGEMAIVPEQLDTGERDLLPFDVIVEMC